jgi:hypothetical protein
VNFDYFGALMFRKQNRRSGLISRRAARYGEVNPIIRQVPRQHNRLDVSFRRRHRANLLLRIRAAAAKSAPGWIAQGRSVQEWDRFRYGYSGTRGRMGLGADPAHPEGPGNFSSPGR